MLDFTFCLKILQFQQQGTPPAGNSEQRSRQENSDRTSVGERIQTGNSLLGSVLTR